MAPTDNPPSNLRMYVNDMLALEKDILEAVGRQRDDERVRMDPGCAALIDRIHTTTRSHVITLENHASAIGGEPGATIKETVMTLTGALAGLYDKLRKHPVSRMLRDDSTALGLAATAYSMLYTTGLALRDLPVANVALRHLREVTPLVMELSEIIPRIVVKELAQDDSEIDMEVVDLARQNTRAAWVSAQS
jgi:hypothetical protein